MLIFTLGLAEIIKTIYVVSALFAMNNNNVMAVLYTYCIRCLLALLFIKGSLILLQQQLIKLNTL